MIRIRLTHGSARVSEQVSKETIEALDALVIAAHNQLKKEKKRKARKNEVES